MSKGKVRAAANGESCIRCDAQNETIVLAHYSGPWQHRFGKGRGIKGADVAAADLCGRCHTEMDEYEGIDDRADEDTKERQRLARSEEFMAYCLLTVIRRIERGILK